MTFQAVRRGVTSMTSHDSALSVSIQEEKDSLEAWKKLEKEQAEAAKYLAKWGQKEEADIQDVTEKLFHLNEKLSEIFASFVERSGGLRSNLKEIRRTEEELFASKKRMKELEEKVRSGAKAGKPVGTMELELKRIEQDILEREAVFTCEKREKLQQGIYMKSDALIEMSQKVQIIATYARYLADQIPQGSLAPGQQLPPYTGTPVTSRIFSDACKALRDYSTNSGFPALPSRNATVSSSSSSFNETFKEALERNEMIPFEALTRHGPPLPDAGSLNDDANLPQPTLTAAGMPHATFPHTGIVQNPRTSGFKGTMPGGFS
ncbi:Eisosome component PIL1-domain-containing protein [Cladochytrium replicatum]|nr:Eisosome component PIL1-domain-containing protein [Cladochytrium replicatum]